MFLVYERAFNNNERYLKKFWVVLGMRRRGKDFRIPQILEQ